MYKVFNCNTDLCVDMKTLLLSDRITKIGKCYPGLLTRDEETHYTFVETQLPTADKRNPRVFDGHYLTITRRGDGTLRLNFKKLVVGPHFSVEKYALGVYNELCMALGGLVGKK